MFIWLCVRWWYGAGWAYAWQRGVADRLRWCENFFSMGDLVRTWFAPFKQTFVGNVKGSLTDHLHAFVDKLVSRSIGFIVRSILLFVGAVCSLLVLASGLIFMVVWALLPLLPIIGFVLWNRGA